uniref:Uncharacterized protein n=1 Tax=Electrophorus electricus TaxID=8005 RepID=A0AAY5EAG4_ELEEL
SWRECNTLRMVTMFCRIVQQYATKCPGKHESGGLCMPPVPVRSRGTLFRGCGASCPAANTPPTRTDRSNKVDT